MADDQPTVPLGGEPQNPARARTARRRCSEPQARYRTEDWRRIWRDWPGQIATRGKEPREKVTGPMICSTWRSARASTSTTQEFLINRNAHAFRFDTSWREFNRGPTRQIKTGI